MNNDLISREALLEAIRTDVAPLTLSMVFQHIYSAPAVDAVEVVRCKDCKNKGMCAHHNGRYIGQFDEDDFCSYGERRENNG